jgi:hippurate hydrolase
LRDLVTGRVQAEYPSLSGIYTNLHAHPELSFMEVKTAAFVAGELRSLGFTVTEKVGSTGVVGVLTNGAGPTVLVRADMDGLPIQENSGVPYASTDIVKDLAGRDQPAMHGCAHDTHVTGLIGTARLLVNLKAQGPAPRARRPARREIVAGARDAGGRSLHEVPEAGSRIALHTTSSCRRAASASMTEHFSRA